MDHPWQCDKEDYGVPLKSDLRENPQWVRVWVLEVWFPYYLRSQYSHTCSLCGGFWALVGQWTRPSAEVALLATPQYCYCWKCASGWLAWKNFHWMWAWEWLESEKAEMRGLIFSPLQAGVTRKQIIALAPALKALILSQGLELTALWRYYSILYEMVALTTWQISSAYSLLAGCIVTALRI